MSRLRSAALAAVLLLAAVGGACRRSDRITIGVVPKGRSQQYWQSVRAGAESAARQLGVEIIWNGPTSETDYPAQIQMVDAMINRRVGAICLAPIDKKAIVGVVERAARERVPVVIMDSGIDTEQFVARVATDNYAAGRMAARRMGEMLGGAGEVAILAVQPGAASAMAREQGFEDEIRERYPKIRVADKRFGMADFAKSLAVAENMLTAHPGLSGMFASNESSTVGAVQALKARKSGVKLVGFDWSPALVEDLRGGVVDSLVVQNPYEMGARAVRTAVAASRGESVTRIQDLPARLIRAGDLEEPEVRALLSPEGMKPEP